MEVWSYIIFVTDDDSNYDYDYYESNSDYNDYYYYSSYSDENYLYNGYPIYNEDDGSGDENGFDGSGDIEEGLVTSLPTAVNVSESENLENVTEGMCTVRPR